MDQQATLDQVAAADIAYIRRHWTALAATAWQGYILHGRGSMLIDMSPGQESRVSYCTRLKPKNAPGHGWLSAETATQIRQYDPRCEMICIILHDDTTVTTYRVCAAVLPPPEAYAHMCLLPQPPAV